MKVIAIVFAFALFAGAFAAYTPNRKMSSVLAQVQNLMETNGPAQAVFDLLDGITEDVRKEQAAHDALHATHQGQCDEELAFRNQQIEEAQGAEDRSVAHEAKCQASLERAEASLEGNLQNQRDTEEAIATKDRIRREEAALFAVRSQQKDDAFAAVDEGLVLLDQLATGQITLLQVSQVAGTMIRKAVQMRQTAAFAPAVTALAQFAASEVGVNAGAVEKVRELLFQVRDQIQAAFTAYQNAEFEAIALYEESRAALVNQLADLRDEESTLRAHIADMHVCIAEETATQQEAIAKRERNSQLLGDATNLCNTYYSQYQTASSARTDELRVIAQLRALVQQRFGSMSAGVYNRADSDEFEAYENQSVYEADYYNKAGGNYNEAGAGQVAYNRDAELERLF